MREFTDEEYNAIGYAKRRCVTGESFSLTNTRYTKKCIGKMPGTWMKTDDSIKFDISIEPAGEHELHFRLSGFVPDFTGEKPGVRLMDIYDRTMKYRNGDCDGNNFNTRYCKGLISHFFALCSDLISGYSYIILGMKCGGRFTGGKESYFEYEEARPEDFLLE